MNADELKSVAALVKNVNKSMSVSGLTFDPACGMVTGEDSRILGYLKWDPDSACILFDGNSQ